MIIQTEIFRAYVAPQCVVTDISLEGCLLTSNFRTTQVEDMDVQDDDDYWE